MLNIYDEQWQEKFDARNAAWEVVFTIGEELVRVNEVFQGEGIDWINSTARTWDRFLRGLQEGYKAAHSLGI